MHNTPARLCLPLLTSQKALLAKPPGGSGRPVRQACGPAQLACPAVSSAPFFSMAGEAGAADQGHLASAPVPTQKRVLVGVGVLIFRGGQVLVGKR